MSTTRRRGGRRAILDECGTFWVFGAGQTLRGELARYTTHGSKQAGSPEQRAGTTIMP